tara:strand:+ start:360 stop:2363 length:2004 start_codon:yes stop_codon:yes gene_type:complete
MFELLTIAALVLAPIDQPNPKLDWWREARFGMFIHWGLYAVPAGTWEDKGTGHAEWIRTTAQIPLETYDQFVDEFNPVNFDADAWCEMANDAGMGYIVITSKHHDGFCLFDSEHTDFDIMSTPFQRDIMMELAEAAPKHDVRMSWYHSIMDWKHPDYLPRRGWELDRSTDGADMQRFRKYLHGQVTELLTKYGPIGIMWFDGEWESTWRGEYGKELYELCVSLQPNVIVNNRLGARGGMEGMTGMDGYAGGYGGDYMTPEQEIPDAVDKGIDWETCMTMNDRWGYNMHDKNFKSTTDLLRKLSDIVSKNGNFLLNIGPKVDGTFPDESIQRLSEIGDWMDVNGEAIHGTVGSPFVELHWGRATQKFNKDSTTLYMHVFDWPKDGKLVIPGLAGKVLSARVLGGNEATFSLGQGETIIDLPSEVPNKHIGVVAVEVQGKPVIYEAPQITASADVFVNSLDVELAIGSEDLNIRYTINENSTYGRYRTPIRIVGTTTIHARSFDENQAVSKIVTKKFTKVKPWKATALHQYSLGELTQHMYKVDWDELLDFSTITPEQTKTVSSVGPLEEEFVALVIDGFLYINSTNMIEFALASDDGSRLLIDDNVVIDNGGLHGTQEKRGAAPLSKGWHKISVEWFNKAGGADLNLRMGVLGDAMHSIASSSFATRK